LTELLKKENFLFGMTRQKSFFTPKNLLKSEPILQYLDFTKPFVLTDASIDATGAVLSQGPIRKDIPIAYASRALNNAERTNSNYLGMQIFQAITIWQKIFTSY
jgi:hypothetical protein